jgi:N-acetylglucosamine kinase-like BadF-type ATPase
MERAFAALAETVTGAFADAGLDLRTSVPVPVGAFCLAGADLPVDERRLSDALTLRGWAAQVLVRNDVLAVSRAGATSGWGVGVVCGTGINCAGLGPDGTTVRFPALGELSGDLCSGGGWLGVRALGLALRAGDGRGPDTALRELVAEHFGRSDVEAVLEAVYMGELGYERLYELSEVAFRAAAAGDAPARQAVDQLADEVVAMATAAIRRLDVASTPVEVVLGGGVVRTTDRVFWGRIDDGIRAAAPAAVIRPLTEPPVLGAALLGLDALGAGDGARARLRESLNRPG